MAMLISSSPRCSAHTHCRPYCVACSRSRMKPPISSSEYATVIELQRVNGRAVFTLLVVVSGAERSCATR